MKKKLKVQGLCFRCENRALFLEGKGQPRCECGQVDSQVCGCYMFKPCKPIITTELDYPGAVKRPRFSSPMLSSRERGVELLNGQLCAVRVGRKTACLLWKEALKGK